MIGRCVDSTWEGGTQLYRWNERGRHLLLCVDAIWSRRDCYVEVETEFIV